LILVILEGFDTGRRQDRLPHALASFEDVFVSEQAVSLLKPCPARGDPLAPFLSMGEGSLPDGWPRAVLVDRRKRNLLCRQ